MLSNLGKGRSGRINVHVRICVRPGPDSCREDNVVKLGLQVNGPKTLFQDVLMPLCFTQVLQRYLF